MNFTEILLIVLGILALGILIFFEVRKGKKPKKKNQQFEDGESEDE